MKKVLVILLVLILIGAAAVIFAPRFMSQSAQPVSGVIEGDALVLAGDALASPDASPEQEHEARDGRLTLTALADLPPPTPAERGVRILLTPDSAARLNDQDVMVEVRYSAPQTGAASGLALSLQGIGPADWVSAPLSPGEHVARFTLPAQFAVDALGLRALQEAAGQEGTVTISEIRVTPAPSTVQAGSGEDADEAPPPQP